MAEGIWSLLLMNQDGKQNYENCFVFGLENSREQKKRHGCTTVLVLRAWYTGVWMPCQNTRFTSSEVVCNVWYLRLVGSSVSEIRKHNHEQQNHTISDNDVRQIDSSPNLNSSPVVNETDRNAQNVEDTHS